MANFFANAVQAALYSALNGDATLTGKITGVFDFVPQDTAFPYVTIGPDVYDDWSGHTFDGGDIELMIHVWSRGAGREENKDIMGEIYRVLHNQAISVSGFNVVLLQFDRGNTEIDPDGQTYHGVMQFRLIVSA